MMIARYEREKKLNVRAEPNEAARIVHKMLPGEEAECFEIRDGWAKLANGYANVALLTVRSGVFSEKPAEVAVVEAAPEPAPEPAQAAEPEPAPEPAADDPEEDEAAELRKMTNPQLYELAEQSGIKVKKGAKKDELIAAILADD